MNSDWWMKQQVEKSEKYIGQKNKDKGENSYEKNI